MSSALTQSNRPIGINTPLGSNVLLLVSFTLTEELGRPFELTAALQSTESAIDFSTILGQQVTVWMNITQTEQRYFNGVVRDFEQLDVGDPCSNYRAVIVPWIGLLAFGSDSRIYQSMTVPDILKQVFSDLGFTDYKEALTRPYATLGVCVQYRETFLNFVSRLMEREGIYYYFDQTSDAHTLILCDAPMAHNSYPDYETIPFNPLSNDTTLTEYIHEWNSVQTIRAGTYTLNDYDYVIPKVSQLSSASVNQSYAQGANALYEAPGYYETPDQGDVYAKIRLQEVQCQQSIQRGKAFCLGIAPGYTFTLSGYPRKDQNALVLTTGIRIECSTTPYQTGAQPADVNFNFRCEFTTIPAHVPFRTPRTTAKPTVNGVQTAIVTGPSSNEPSDPYTSKYGSVKVQFHWDRYGQNNENSSGWIRVSQISAGNGWGSMFVPRIGNEVIVSFEEGDPDRPIITGAVYNASSMPPLRLPEFAQRCYITDDSMNAICFTPESGKESISLYSPHQETLRVIGAAYDAEIPDPVAPATSSSSSESTT